MGVISDAIDALEDWCCDLFKDGIKSQFDGISDLLTNTFTTTTGSGGSGGLVSSYLTKHPAGFTGGATGGTTIWSTILGSQLIAEIGDIRNLHSGKALVAMAGIDPPPHQSGTVDTRSRSISKRGSPALRKTLFQVIGVYLQRQPEDEPVYQFLEKKRAEGKPYKVYMIAAAHKFLRIYYARIREVMPTQ